ncbi:DUF2971 domain-containing protein [Yersinia hibernica]|nr:DUF2971 domain-containing protein [Yersinia hibernica]
MTTDKENIYMWSHYADNHKGVMIEFTFDENEAESLFHGSANVYKNSPTKPATGFYHAPVNYKKSRRTKTSNGDIENIINTLYFRKSIDWDKESEYRFILPFTESHEVLLTQDGLDNLLKHIDFHGFKEQFIKSNDSKGHIFKIDSSGISELLKPHHLNIFHEIWKLEGSDCMFVMKMNTDRLTGIYFGCRSNINKCEHINNTSYFDGRFYSLRSDSIRGIHQASVDDNEFKINFSPIKPTILNLAE